MSKAPLTLPQIAPALAVWTGLGLDALRAHERALRIDPVASALHFNSARTGPAGGTLATPTNVAALVLAGLSGQTRADLPKFVVDLWHAVPADSVCSAIGTETRIGDLVIDTTPALTIERDGLTNCTIFGASLRTLLGDRDLAECVECVVIFQDEPEAHVVYRYGSEIRRARFYDSAGGQVRAASLAKRGIARVTATLPGRTLADIAAMIAARPAPAPGPAAEGAAPASQTSECSNA
jgi:hypothetical protein